MRIIVCIDKKNGMMFNHRRQSRDKAQIADMARLLGGAPLRIAPYSEKLLSDSGIVLAVSEDPLADAGSDDWCFIEDRSVASCADRVTEAVLYHWNRDYPGDLFFDLDLSGFKKKQTVKFPGNSHEKITKEVWRK